MLGNMTNKLLTDNSNHYSLDITVAWAVSPKNVLHSCCGISPNQVTSVQIN